jgi:hypothetical protein
MAVLILTNAYCSVNGTDLSDHVKTVTVSTTDDQVEITAMGATAKTYAKGLGDATITVEFFQDYAAAKVDATLFPLKASSTPFTVGVRPVNSARSTTNPEYQISALLYGYNPLDGGVGAASSTSVTFANASQSGMSRLTS